MKLRPYQVQAINNFLEGVKKGIKLQVIVLPTGTGKTVVFSQLPPIVKKASGKKTLILAHRQELLTQAKSKLEACNPGISVGIEQGGNSADVGNCDVIVASVQTLGREGSDRIKKLNPEEFGLIIIDESHHSTATSYQNILEYFGANKQRGLAQKHPVVLGVTATPSRADNVGLDLIFDQVTYKYDIKSAIQEGYLADIKAYTVLTEQSLDGVSVRAGDFAVGELSETVNTDTRNQLIVDSYSRIIPGEIGIVFAVDVQHAVDLAKKFNDNGIPADYVHGGNTDEERAEKFKSFESGKTKVLTNVGIATEGYDNPNIKGVLLARPTKSNTLYIQMVGRGTRIAPGKDGCKIIDFVDNMSKNSIVSASTIIGLEQPIKANGESIISLQEKLEELLDHSPSEDLLKLDLSKIDERIKEVDIFAMAQLSEFVKEHSKYSWTQTLGGLKISLGVDEKENPISAEIRENLLGKYDIKFYRNETVTPSHKNGFSKYNKVEIFSAMSDTKVGALEKADEEIWINHRKSTNFLKQSATWRGEAPTEKQVSLLKKFGFNNADQLSKGQASVLLSKYFADKNDKRKQNHYKKA